MPSCITHQLIAERAREFFPAPVRSAAEEHEDYFFLGAQGPDVFFFYRPLSHREWNFGRYLHRFRVYDVFSYFLKQTQEESDPRLTAYTAGYVSHYAADTLFHPLVYRYLEESGACAHEHRLMEGDWDSYFARVETGLDAAGWKFPFSAGKINAEGLLFRLYEGLSLVLERTPPKRRAFARGITLFGRYLKFFHRPARHEGLARLERALHLRPALSSLYPRREIDPAYLHGEDFRRLSGKADADELFGCAVRETAALVTLLFDCAENAKPLPKAPFEKNFLTAAPAGKE